MILGAASNSNVRKQSFENEDSRASLSPSEMHSLVSHLLSCNQTAGAATNYPNCATDRPAPPSEPICHGEAKCEITPPLLKLNTFHPQTRKIRMEAQGLVAKLTSSICTPFIAVSEGRATPLLKTDDFNRCWALESDLHGLYIDDEGRSVCEEPRCNFIC